MKRYPVVFVSLQTQKDLLQTKAAKGLDISQRTGPLGYLCERIDDTEDLWVNRGFYSPN
mgnify:CR=1 FL=1